MLLLGGWADVGAIARVVLCGPHCYIGLWLWGGVVVMLHPRCLHVTVVSDCNTVVRMGRAQLSSCLASRKIQA